MSCQIEMKMTIPNILSLFRIVLIPVFAVLYLLSDGRPALLYGSFAVLALSGLTDALDGIIARKCHQISDFGKLLDPIADKATQTTVVVCMAIRYPQLIGLVVLCITKEVCQAIGGLILLHKGQSIRGAKWYGKVSTFVFYGVMAAIVLFPAMPRPLFWTLISLVAVVMLFAFFSYLREYCRLHRDLSAEKDPNVK